MPLLLFFSRETGILKSSGFNAYWKPASSFRESEFDDSHYPILSCVSQSFQQIICYSCTYLEKRGREL